MVISIVLRKTAVTDRADWEARLRAALPGIMEVLRAEPGFVSLQYLWGVDGDGEMGQITTWRSLEECRRYIHGGAAATVAMQEDRALPTAPYPAGAWVRRTFEMVGGSPLIGEESGAP